MKKFTGIMPALITPFDENYKIRQAAVRELMDFHYERGVKGFYVCGNTGEGPVLPAKTRMEMTEVVLEHNKGRGKVICHVGAPCDKDVKELVKHAEQSGVDALSSLPPNFFYQYTDEETYAYFKSIADGASLPVLVYATVMMQTTDLRGLMRRLMKIPNVIGLKYTIPNYYEMSLLRKEFGDEINIINGPDETILAGLSMGMDGGIGSTYNVMPGLFVKLYEHFQKNEIAQARECQLKINGIIDVLKKHSENGAIKAIKEALKLMGFDMGSSAFPGKTYSKAETDELKKELIAAGLDRLN